MTHRHWSDDDLLLRLYLEGEPDPGVPGFADGCAECRQRWERLREARAAVLAPVEVPPARLARQRAAVLRRIEKQQLGWSFSRLAPALATACVLVLGVLLGTPTPQPQPTLAQNDENFYSDVYQLASEFTPAAVAPIAGLFETEEQ